MSDPDNGYISIATRNEKCNPRHPGKKQCPPSVSPVWTSTRLPSSDDRSVFLPPRAPSSSRRRCSSQPDRRRSSRSSSLTRPFRCYHLPSPLRRWRHLRRRHRRLQGTPPPRPRSSPTAKANWSIRPCPTCPYAVAMATMTATTTSSLRRGRGDPPRTTTKTTTSSSPSPRRYREGASTPLSLRGGVRCTCRRIGRSRSVSPRPRRETCRSGIIIFNGIFIRVGRKGQRIVRK